jgi:RimJ/RimL family protein N-acetyltransferase
MEMMPHHVQRGDVEPAPRSAARPPLPTFGPAQPHDWRTALPTMITPLCTLRELRLEDAASLCAQLTTEEVSRFISPPPTTVEGFEAFIRWTHDQRARGRYACFGVVPNGEAAAVGLFQVCLRDQEPMTAEWGFVLGSSYWGTGIFIACARRVLEFVFTQLPVRCLKALAVPMNGRGNGALRKVGAVRTGLLKGSLDRFGERLDQAVWIISRRDWLASVRNRWRQTVH